MATTITLGRAPHNSIPVSASYDQVSNEHADLTLADDGTLHLTDHSTNGTTVNGLLIKGQTITVTSADNILLAGSYPIDWAVVKKHMPNLDRKAPPRATERFDRYDKINKAAEQPSADAASRGTERFDRHDKFNKGDRQPSAEVKPKTDTPTQKRFTASFLSGISRPTLWISAGIFAAIIAILALTVFDDVVKQIM